MDTGNIVLWVLVYERNLNVKDFALASLILWKTCIRASFTM